MSGNHQSVKEKRDFFDNAAAGWTTDHDDRDRMLLDRMIQTCIAYLPDSEGPVIDLGCGTGVLFSYLHDIPFCGMDISHSMLVRAKTDHTHTGIGLCQADAHAFPFFDSSVAGIIGFAVLPHIDRHEVFLSECRRILIRGGILFIAHLRSAGEINAFHRSVGGAVANDHLPEAVNMARMISKYGFSIEVNDTDDKYMIVARKL